MFGNVYLKLFRQVTPERLHIIEILISSKDVGQMLNQEKAITDFQDGGFREFID